jgi:hypothetical protein
MKRLLASLFFLGSALSFSPASAQPPDCLWGGSTLTQANNGDVLTVAAVQHVCIITPVPVSSIGGSNFPTGITTGVPGMDGPFATVASALGGWVLSTTPTGPFSTSTFEIDSPTQSNAFNLDQGGTAHFTSDVVTGSAFIGPSTILGTYGVDNPTGVIIYGTGLDNFTQIGTNSTVSCGGIAGGGLLIADAGGSFPLITADPQAPAGHLGICAPLTVGAAVTATSYTDSTINATMSLGQAAPPSGACISGSIYTNAAGTTLATTRYTCVATVWIGG